MSTIETLTKKFNDAQAEQEKLQREMEEFKARQAELEKKAEEAAEAGDDEGYLRIREEADRAGALAHVRAAKMRRNETPISPKEAAEAWSKFAKTAEKEIAKGMEAYITERKALFDKLKSVIQKEKSAFWVRQDLMRYTGQYENPESGYFSGGHLDHLFPIEAIKGTDVRNDLELFHRLGLLSMEEFSGLILMINGHTV